MLMNINNWLEAERGRVTALAAHVGITPAAISQWKHNGVPLEQMKTVRDFTKGEVTLEEMVPDSGNSESEVPEQAQEA